MVGICDANNFYVSCERVFNPALNGRPTVVLSNNDRCIIARSNEAKAVGLKMGQPIYQVRDTLCTHNVVLCSPNFPLYQDMSDRMMTILQRFAPAIIYSIDEAFWISGASLPAKAGRARPHDQPDGSAFDRSAGQYRDRADENAGEDCIETV